MLNGTLVIHLIPVIADRLFLVYKALSATQIHSNVHCFLNSFSLSTNTLLSSMFPESIFRYSGRSPSPVTIMSMINCLRSGRWSRLVSVNYFYWFYFGCFWVAFFFCLVAVFNLGFIFSLYVH